MNPKVNLKSLWKGFHRMWRIAQRADGCEAEWAFGDFCRTYSDLFGNKLLEDFYRVLCYGSKTGVSRAPARNKRIVTAIDKRFIMNLGVLSKL